MHSDNFVADNILLVSKEIPYVYCVVACAFKLGLNDFASFRVKNLVHQLLKDVYFIEIVTVLLDTTRSLITLKYMDVVKAILMKLNLYI